MPKWVYPFSFVFLICLADSSGSFSALVFEILVSTGELVTGMFGADS